MRRRGILRDHPRIRGEHLGGAHATLPPRGSSPHTRGARHAATRRDTRLRIIPAYAGSTSASFGRYRVRPDHPRIRGEHRKMRAMAGNLKGSSPHTRGAHVVILWVEVGERIIPAYAGSTKTGRPGERRRRDHPRIRGEHADQVAKTKFGRGSSPHTRGARSSRSPGLTAKRIIPAYAGSTRGSCRQEVPRWDHPRIRGEHHLGASTCTSASGSSPHTRGAPARRRYPAGLPRIIPAYAGSTC